MSKLKIGSRVRFVRTNGCKETGKVAEIDDLINGRWVSVNISDQPRRPKFFRVRASKLEVLA